MIDYSQILSVNYKGSQWAMSNEDYATLQWFSDTPKPTQEELDALIPNTANEVAKQNCKSEATSILSQTDWTSIPDVGNPDASNPYLVNQAEFISYRSTIRNYAVNPVVDPIWPTQPTEQWSN
jgi:hypothetical protein